MLLSVQIPFAPPSCCSRSPTGFSGLAWSKLLPKLTQPGRAVVPLRFTDSANVASLDCRQRSFESEIAAD